MTRGNITKRGKASWQLKLEAPAVAGKRKYHYVTIRGSYQDAQKALTRLLATRDTGMLPAPTQTTVGDYMQAWLATATGRSPKTLERYGELTAWQIGPHLAGVPLQKLTPEMIRHWHAALIGKGLAPRTVISAHRLLRQVLACAVKEGKLARNVADVHAPPKARQKEIQILSTKEIPSVLAALQGHTYHPIVALALGTGMRRGELLGLQWGDVNLDGTPPTLMVKRSLEQIGAGLRLKEPKSESGLRSVTLARATVAVLRAHRVAQMQFRFAVGASKLEADAPVFCNVHGEPLKPHTVSRTWQRLVKDKGLPRVTFHALRHTHVSVLIRQGVELLTIARRIGHSKPSVTLDVYGHLMGGADEAAAAAIEGVLK